MHTKNIPEAEERRGNFILDTYMYLAGFLFLAIRENIRASLVESWFVLWRECRSSQNTHCETNSPWIFSRIAQKPAQLHVGTWFRLIESTKNAHYTVCAKYLVNQMKSCRK